MPMMDGFALFERVRSRWPSLVERLVFLARAPIEAPAHRALRVVNAPDDRRQLLDTVRGALGPERR